MFLPKHIKQLTAEQKLAQKEAFLKREAEEQAKREAEKIKLAADEVRYAQEREVYAHLIEQLLAFGDDAWKRGKLWQKGEHIRVYFNDASVFYCFAETKGKPGATSHTFSKLKAYYGIKERKLVIESMFLNKTCQKIVVEINEALDKTLVFE
ncbi:hypothetical protein FHQ26_05495 [Testudinibacter sp. TR-2022]|uniref:hypothetical protein n=1 Tax=Testudinibacter sp. TR-2022 TaxID=2585029 RepID=UPI001118E494|nr:hypothetical protein [Testudinibacter sp. TR-2022]TNH04951.1 hypothetical protein FHQ22_02650 [Pasteurellaceae bacterium Phil31]TNH06732.1 hypothetical protein FHQ25_12070 [Testudinibacter sp. TR-2022]TNH10229.1 hypothetical protein FHQ26_05495 [Testudinibacter sp. TR-2022]